MDQGTTDRGLTDRGVSSVQFLLAAGLGLILFLALANLVVVQYGRGAVQSALEQGARAGSLSGSSVECEAVARDVVSQLLGGEMSHGLTISCAPAGALMTAQGSGEFAAWTPMSPPFSVSLVSEAVMEPPP